MLEVEAAEAAAGLSELSAWWRTLHSRVTEDIMVWRIDRMPERASARCFWSTLTCNWEAEYATRQSLLLYHCAKTQKISHIS